MSRDEEGREVRENWGSMGRCEVEKQECEETCTGRLQPWKVFSENCCKGPALKRHVLMGKSQPCCRWVAV